MSVYVGGAYHTPTLPIYGVFLNGWSIRLYIPDHKYISMVIRLHGNTGRCTNVKMSIFTNVCGVDPVISAH